MLFYRIGNGHTVGFVFATGLHFLHYLHYTTMMLVPYELVLIVWVKLRVEGNRHRSNVLASWVVCFLKL